MHKQSKFLQDLNKAEGVGSEPEVTAAYRNQSTTYRFHTCTETGVRAFIDAYARIHGKRESYKESLGKLKAGEPVKVIEDGTTFVTLRKTGDGITIHANFPPGYQFQHNLVVERGTEYFGSLVDVSGDVTSSVRQAVHSHVARKKRK
jgi:hypothetical protein